MKAAVVGSGGWGTALALCLLRNGHETLLWSHSRQKAEEMEKTRQNNMLPGVILPEDLQIAWEPSRVAGHSLVVIACPSVHIRSVCRQVAPYLAEDAVLVSVTKGIEPGSLLRMSQIVREETHREVAVLTGPSHAEEVAKNIPTACVAASENQALAELVQDAFMSDSFRVYTSADVVGSELGGALKNVIALCAGVSDGMGNGDNTKAMLMTRGLTEIARLGVAMGARKETFAGLAGVGDLIVTCTSQHSRNRRAGILMGQGKSPKDAMAAVGAVVEGYYAAKSAWELACKLGVEMPIIHGAYRALYENVDVKTVLKSLLCRARKAETEDAGWL